MKKQISVILLVLSQVTLATNNDSGLSCKKLQPVPKSITYTEYLPSFFTKTLPISKDLEEIKHFQGLVSADEDFGTYIAKASGEKNRIIKLNPTSGQREEIVVPGSYDPVPSPDGRILTVVNPMRVFDTREFFVKKDHQTEPMEKGFLKGVYQSVAWLRGAALQKSLKILYPHLTCEKNNLSQNNNCKIRLHQGEMDFKKQRLYRIIADGTTDLPFADVLVDFNPNCNVRQTAKSKQGHCLTTHVLKQKYPEGMDPKKPYSFCGKEFKLKTLFISKKGTYVSGYHAKSGSSTSKIFDITTPGDCREVLDLGYPLGKIDFNDAEDKITFHVDYFKTNTGGYFSMVGKNSIKDVFLMNLEKGKDRSLKVGDITRLTTTTKKGQGCYYPSFFNDQIQNNNGQVIERVLCMNDEGKDSEGNFSFRVMDVTHFKNSIIAQLPGQNKDNVFMKASKNIHQSAVLGIGWANMCEPTVGKDFSIIELASFLPSINYQDCVKLADLWENSKSFRNEVINDVRIEDSPRFHGPSYFKKEIAKQDLIDSCTLVVNNQILFKIGLQKTEVFGKDGQFKFSRLSGKEIAKQNCSGCHHSGAFLHAATDIDTEAGVSQFPGNFEFENPNYPPNLIKIDQSLERIGYNPLVHMKELPHYEKWLGDRIMPPPGRGALRVVPEQNYDERKILAEYLYELRKKTLEKIKSSGR